MKIQEPIYVTVTDGEDIKKYLLIQRLNSGIIINFILNDKDLLMPNNSKLTVYDFLKRHNLTVHIQPNIPKFEKSDF